MSPGWRAPCWQSFFGKLQAGGQSFVVDPGRPPVSATIKACAALAQRESSNCRDANEFFLGGRPKKRADEPPPGRGRKGLRRTTKRPLLAVVQRPSATSRGTPAGDARAAVVANLSMDEVERVLEKEIEPKAHLMSDEWKCFANRGYFSGICIPIWNAEGELVGYAGRWPDDTAVEAG